MNGKNIMENKTNVIIKYGTEEDFFNNARSIMQKLDKGEIVEPAHIITFGDPVDMVKFLTPKKLEMINLIRSNPSKTITELAVSLKRNRSSVSRDINSMADVGIIKVDPVNNPGHGRSKIVNLMHDTFLLQAAF